MNFEEHLHKYLSHSEINALLKSLEKSEQKGVLLNVEKMSDEHFKELFPYVIAHPFVPHAYLYDKEKCELGRDIHHDLGCYYIQDPSAMLVSYFLGAKEDELVLDLCAAPGGKSVQASLNMHHRGVLISNDLSSARTQILLSNIERMGLDNVIVANLDFEKIYTRYINAFDRIILDAPCSGSGMFRKSIEMKKDWSYEKVLANAKVQARLLSCAYQMLKPGGRLIYSTCSYSFEEDEQIILNFLKENDAKLIDLPKDSTFYRSKELPEAIHLFPSRYLGEGHFICAIEKPGTLSNNKKIEQVMIERHKINKGGKPIIERYRLPMNVPQSIIDLAQRPGLFVETKTKEECIPSHHFCHASKSDENSIELSENELLKYLHGEQLTHPCRDGYNAVSYDHIPLGIVRAKNGILKNLYPKGLRR